MQTKKDIQRIVENGSQEDMEELSDIFLDLMYFLKECDERTYKKYRMLVHCMAYGDVLSEEMAEEIVSNMKPSGMRWNLEDTRHMQEDYGLTDIPDTNFFTVINSGYNDYKDIFGDNLETYIKFTLDFINDEDAPKGKVVKYFTL